MYSVWEIPFIHRAEQSEIPIAHVTIGQAEGAQSLCV